MTLATPLLSHDGELELFDHFIPAVEAEVLFCQLRDEIAWQEESITLYGKTVKVPRLVCWYGDADATYTYSGTHHIPLPWLPILLTLKVEIEALISHPFNSVLANLYRNQYDSVGWHADNESELGRNPTIASLSLGETRLFKLQHTKTKEIHDISLTSGSLLVMRGALQHHWRHCVPKSTQEKGARINLTFRQIGAKRK